MEENTSKDFFFPAGNYFWLNIRSLNKGGMSCIPNNTKQHQTTPNNYKPTHSLILLLFFLLTLIWPGYSEISREEAKNIVLEQIVREELGKIDVYFLKGKFTSTQKLKIVNKNLNLPYPTNWVFSIFKNDISPYSLTGAWIITLLNRYLDKGNHTVHWNGINQFGQPVASGIYLYELQSGNYRVVKKMLLVK